MKSPRYTKTWYVWWAMRQRCEYRKDKAYHNYGGRGIKVHDDWLKFDNFLADMGWKPEGLTLERVTNDEYYGPLNCIWATRKEQTRNMRRNVFVELNGRRQCVRDWCTEFGIHPATVQKRRRAGWSWERAFSTRPVITGRPKKIMTA